MANLQARIGEEIHHNKVMMYSKTTCPFCNNAKRALSDAGVEFEVVELDRIPEGRALQDALLEMTHQRTVPNIFIGAEHVGGCSELMDGMRNGRVPQLFNKHGIPFRG